MIKLKINKTVTKRFNSDCTAYGGIKDAFNNTCYLIVNDLLKEMRVVSVNKFYDVQKERYKKVGLSDIKVPRYLEVIDLTEETINVIETLFPNYAHSEWSIW